MATFTYWLAILDFVLLGLVWVWLGWQFKQSMDDKEGWW